MEERQKIWQEKSCTLMFDGWTNHREQSIINFFIKSTARTIFLELVDASKYSKIVVKLFELLDTQIKKIEEQNILQVVTDSHSSYVFIGLIFILFSIVYHTFTKLE